MQPSGGVNGRRSQGFPGCAACIRLHVGVLAGAEDAFRHAHELGRDPQLGLALLRLAEGNVAGALTAIKSAVAGQTRDRLLRARMLPAFVDIAAVAQDPDTAAGAVEELAAIARNYGSPALEAKALSSRGALHLARSGDSLAVAAFCYPVIARAKNEPKAAR